MTIRVLAPELVSKIAAGEVIERPASVAKELIENSLDAGASQISVETQGGGVDLVRVADNGGGIPASEVELAFRRHATSKISSLEELGSIRSLGFRGEALPCIAAVAEVEVLTKAESDAVGSYLYLRQGELARKESRARPRGCTVTVRRLFRQVPARLKFLKSGNTENSHVATVVSQYAMAYPEVGFRLLLDGHVSLHTPGNGLLRDVMSQTYGLDVAQAMLDVEDSKAAIRVSGLVSPPALARSNRRYLSFFINRRWARSPLLVRAAEESYHGLLMEGRHPLVALNVSLPPEEIDVNVHPAKTEVRFSSEQAVFSSVTEAVKGTLHRTPVATTKTVSFSSSSYREQSTWTVTETEAAFVAPLPAPGLPALRVMGQLASTYIIGEGPKGLYLVDQHAAHERVLYEEIQAQWSRHKIEVQGLLQATTVEFSPREEQIWEANKEKLAQFGFAVEPFGGRSYLLRSVPATVAGTDIVEALRTLLEAIAGMETTPLDEKIMQSLACHAAIRAGQRLSNVEMAELIQQLERAKQPRTCPHGRPTMIHLSSRQLEKEFGRTG